MDRFVFGRHSLTRVLVAGAAAALISAAWAGTASSKPAGKTISVAIVKNPQMTDIASLTPSLFTSTSGIKVKYTILDEGKLRQITT
ncbi:MAG: polyol transport system substrate-binding protein, partial [Gaiellales bacterium]|nr:polyol transport system substrate-binding protein [Gaiellales bacterium]